MAVEEGLVLDGLDLNQPPGGMYWLEALSIPAAKKRQEWLQAGDADGSALVRDPLYENITITAKVRAQAATRDLLGAAIAAITAKLEEAERQPDGLPVVWTPAEGTLSLTYYALSGEIEELPITVESGYFADPPSALLSLRLDCKPFGYAPEEYVGAANASAPFVTIEIPDVAGDVPAEGRLIVNSGAAQNRRHIEWGLEQRYYDPTTSLLVDSDALVLTGFAGAQATRTGAWDPNAIGNNVVRATLYHPITAICSTGQLAHVGSYRVKARVWATSWDAMIRLAWQEGDGPYRANQFVGVPVYNAFCEVDLGVISIPPATLGAQSWTGRIEGYTTTDGDTVDVDYLVLIPVEEGYGRAVAAYTYQPGPLVAMENFAGISGDLNGRVATLGGSWTTSGDVGDFTSSSAPAGSADQAVNRGTLDATVGRFAILGTGTYTDTEDGIWVYAGASASFSGGPIARYIDTNNYLTAFFSYVTNQFAVRAIVGGVDVRTVVHATIGLTNAWYRVRLIAYQSGRVIGLLLDLNGAVLGLIDTVYPECAAGGPLASGKAGFHDSGASAASPRYYDNFYIATPAPEPIALFSGQSAEIRHDGAIREDQGGSRWGPVPAYRGSRFLIPPAGDQGRTSRVLAKAHRNNIDTAEATPVNDPLDIEVRYTPRFTAPPR